MTDNVLPRKLKALISIRVVFITLLLGLFFVLAVGYSNLPHPRATLNLIIALYSLTIIYAVVLGIIKQYTIFAYIQLSVDVLAINTLIYLTGGIESWFSFMMPLTVLSASVVLNRRAGYIIATVNSIFYGLMIELQYYGFLKMGYNLMLSEKDFLYHIFAHVSAFYLVAFLSGYLSARLEKTSKDLEQKDSDLRELTLFSEELIENIPSGVFTTDMDGYILLFNMAAENITGISRKIAVGKKIVEILPFIARLSDVERTEGLLENTGKTLSLTVSGLIDVTGRKTGFIGIFQDVTKLKKLESEMKQKEKMAAIGELSANIAHEIRNPLASLKSSVEMLREDKVSKEYKDRLAEIALKEMERLNKIITDFLAYSRPQPVKLKTFDLNLALDDTLELLKNTVQTANNILLIKDFGGELFINADQQKIRQVLWNLAVNAMEAMPEGGELKVSTKKEGQFIIISFKDTGIGIQPDNMGKIFYPFFTTKPEGTGLGLAIAYRIIEEHNGRITIETNPGKGVTFIITIPYGNGKS